MIRDQVVGREVKVRLRVEHGRGRLGTMLLVLGGLALGLAAVIVGGYQVAYQDRVYAGVSLAGRDLGGMQAGDVRAVLSALDMPGGQVVLRTADGRQAWTYSLRDLGAALDTDAIVRAALAYGRSGNLAADWGAQLAALRQGVILATPTRMDADAIPRLVDSLAAQVDRAAVAGRVESGAGTPVVVPGQPGVALDRAVAVALLRAALSAPAQAPPLTLPVRSVAAPGDAGRLQAMRDAGLALAAAPITVRVAHRAATLALPPAALQQALVWTSNGSTLATAQLDRVKIQALLAPFAAALRLAPQDATLKLVRGRPALLSDVAGWDVDLETATSAVLAAAATPDRTVTLPLRMLPATVSLADAQPVYAQWQALLSNGFTLRYGQQSWTIKGARLAGGLALAGNQGGGGQPYRLQLDSILLKDRIAAIAGEVDVLPRDGRFRQIDGAVQVVAAPRDGQQLDQPASLAAAQTALTAGQTTVDLVVVARPAAVAGSTVPAALSPPDLLATASTTYYGSSPERAHNVEFGTSLVDGALIPPGAEFDLNATLGPLTLGAGFQMGWGIVSDGTDVTTVPAEAGGICQVATTLFQSVFWAGLPITERHHHSYWISSYGKPPSGLKGLDATIAPPDADFRWRNTTGNWILVRALAADGVVHFELWGTNPHWQVQVDGPVITDVVPTNYTPIYEHSAALPAGITREVEHAQTGFTADIHRQVFAANGTALDDWHAQGIYLPSHDRYIVGTRGRP